MPASEPGEEFELPSPAGEGVYDFTDRLWALHEQEDRSATAAPGEGKLLVSLEPHPDDMALSIGGRLALERRPLLVVSVCSEAGTAHPGSRFAGEAGARIAAARREENRAALGALGAEIIELGMPDATKPYRPRTEGELEGLLGALDERLGRLSEPFELVAPAAVTRHPDHVLVHEAARRLGCRWFWEDTAFFPTYARCVEDRRWFEEGHGSDLEPELFDITDAVLAKVAMLGEYRSQAPSPDEVCGVLRYAWTVGAEAGDPGRYMERSYRLS